MIPSLPYYTGKLGCANELIEAGGNPRSFTNSRKLYIPKTKKRLVSCRLLEQYSYGLGDVC